MNSAKVESRIISLVCYMITSARGLVDEPKIYGPSRLLEAARRLIDLAADCGIRHDPLLKVAREIEEHRLEILRKDKEEFISFMDALAAILATWVEGSQAILEDNGEGGSYL